MAPRLPTPGRDGGDWGELLNAFLRVAHNPDGTLKLADIVAEKYTLPSTGLPRNQLASDVQASLTKADGISDTSLLSDLDDVDVQVPAPSDGQALTFSRAAGKWVNTDLPVPVITKTDIGLENVTNEQQLPLTGGALTGNLRLNGGSYLRAYHIDNSKYIEIKADNFWSRINAGGTSGFVLTGATVQMDASSQIVTFTPTLRPNTNLGTHLGATTHYYNNLYARRHYFNATAYLDGATNGAIGLSDGLSLTLGTTIGTMLGTASTQKLGLFGAIPVVQQPGGVLTAGGSYTANERTMINAMWSALRNIGIMN